MNSSTNNSRILNSLVNVANTAARNFNSNLNTATASMNLGLNSSGTNSRGWTSWIPSWWVLLLLAIAITATTLGFVYKSDIETWWRTNIQKVNDVPALPPSSEPPKSEESKVPTNEPAHPFDTSNIVEKVLPSIGGKKEVFNVSSNRFTYYDAEPLCRALGAELATIDQVKDAWGKGADWCNYGWVKGQMAVYPTQKDTYDKLQKGPAEQAASCGKVGVNGGFFDNPELRFGVNCVGTKPAQSQHDEKIVSGGIPMSPDALEVDKKIQQFKRETDSIGILPFSSSSWSS